MFPSTPWDYVGRRIRNNQSFVSKTLVTMDDQDGSVYRYINVPTAAGSGRVNSVVGRPSGTRLITLFLPGTSVPGSRLFRPSGTALMRPSGCLSQERATRFNNTLRALRHLLDDRKSLKRSRKLQANGSSFSPIPFTHPFDPFRSAPMQLRCAGRMVPSQPYSNGYIVVTFVGVGRNPDPGKCY
jgi:hypothetical protein